MKLFDIDYIGRYFKDYNEGIFKFKISSRASENPILTRVADIISKSPPSAIERKVNALGYEVIKRDWSLGKVGDISWCVPEDRCYIRLTNGINGKGCNCISVPLNEF